MAQAEQALKAWEAEKKREADLVIEQRREEIARAKMARAMEGRW